MIMILGYIYPFLFIIPIFWLYLNYSKKYCYNLIFSLSLLAALYTRIDGLGDLSRYINSYNNYFKNIEFLNMYTSDENKYYFIWSLLNYLGSIFQLNFSIITFFSFLLYFYAIFKIFDLIDISQNRKYKKQIIIKFFLCTPLVILFSSYKNSVSFALIIYGLYKKFLLKRNSTFFIIIGLGFHGSGIVLILLYYLSKMIKIKKINYLLIIVLSFILKYLLVYNSSFLLELPLPKIYIEKFIFYTLGEWGAYKFNSLNEIYLYFYMIELLLLVLLSMKKSCHFKNLNNYSNYMRLYIIFLLIIVPYRTLAIRFIIASLPLYLLLFYQNLLLTKNKIFKVFFIFIIDIRILGFIYSDGYQIGRGFFKELFRNILTFF